MGEAYLIQKGGNTFRGLVVIAPPDKTEYYAGEYADLTGMVIGADFGTLLVPLAPQAYACSPVGALKATDAAITVTATVGRRTGSVAVPITVSPISTNFGDNTWDAIAYVAARGEAADYWAVGDSKTENGITYTIIGMDHDSLSDTDAKYADPSYNGNTKKAALTIQVMTAAGPAAMNETATNIGGWDESYLRNTVLPAYFAGMPADLRAAIRTVTKVTSLGGYETYNVAASKDELFLLNVSEIYTYEERGYQLIIQGNESSANPQYRYYAMGGAKYKGSAEWTRSPYNPAYGSGSDRFISIENDVPGRHDGGYNGLAQKSPTVSRYYFPAFCI